MPGEGQTLELIFHSLIHFHTTGDTQWNVKEANVHIT